MSDRMDDLAARISVADISTAVAYGLQRSLERRELSDLIADRILRYGGRVHFEIEIAPQLAKGTLQQIPQIDDRGGFEGGGS